jgi:HD-GYP domain-containing protein (c-di-GMP phosphodiesterase class II)
MAPITSISLPEVSSPTPLLDAALLRCDDVCTRRLVRELDESDHALADHGAGVAALAVAVGRRLRFGTERLETLCRAALLHDAGKRLLPPDLLAKPGPLSAPERRVVEGHAGVGSLVLLQEGLLSEASIVRHHHERWDGAGYPDRLRGEEIPLESRIILVADTFDAMTSDRPYRVALSHETALEEIRRGAGSQMDPACVAVALDILGAAC